MVEGGARAFARVCPRDRLWHANGASAVRAGLSTLSTSSQKPRGLLRSGFLLSGQLTHEYTPDGPGPLCHGADLTREIYPSTTPMENSNPLGRSVDISR